MARLHGAARTIFGRPGIFKWEGLNVALHRDVLTCFYPVEVQKVMNIADDDDSDDSLDNTNINNDDDYDDIYF